MYKNSSLHAHAIIVGICPPLKPLGAMDTIVETYRTRIITSKKSHVCIICYILVQNHLNENRNTVDTIMMSSNMEKT